jgi:hypothetical protein
MRETMTEEKRYTEEEAHRFFAVHYNGLTWQLLYKAERTKEEAELMVLSAQASCRHWLEVGTGLHHQRGEWLIARVYAVLELAEASLRHANRCLELTKEYADLMEDFDRAFAYEGVARANAIAGDRGEALRYITLAEEAGQAIADEENRKLFFDDLGGGNWNNMR